MRLPAHRRTLTTPYRAITSERLHAVIGELLKTDAWLGVDVAAVGAEAVVLADGRRLTAPLVIDARGPRRSRSLALGWQKFLGQEVRLATPHGLTRPIVMDATVGQLDGYRFLYVLPLDEGRLLIEDTRYSDGPALDHAELARDIAAYAARQGWTIAETLREENGVLPIALAGDIDGYWAEAPSPVAEAGLRAALFHPTTGYSLPDAARQAETIAALPALTTAAVDGRAHRPVESRLEGARLLPPPEPHALPRRGAGPALPRAGAVLPPAPAADRTVLRRRGQLRRTSSGSSAASRRCRSGRPWPASPKRPLLAEQTAA